MYQILEYLGDMIAEGCSDIFSSNVKKSLLRDTFTWNDDGTGEFSAK
jgi:hypothetical protein